MISSNWKLTYNPAGTPLVILNFGDKLDDELRFGFATGVDVVPLVDSFVPFLRATGNGVFQISFRRLLSQSSDKLARGAVLDWLLDNDALTKAPLKIEIQSGTYATYQFTSAVITQHETQRILDSPECRYAVDFQITAAGLTRTLL